RSARVGLYDPGRARVFRHAARFRRGAALEHHRDRALLRRGLPRGAAPALACLAAERQRSVTRCSLNFVRSIFMSFGIKRLAFAILVPLGLALAHPAAALDKLTVQLAFYPQGPQAYLFVAQTKGWFEKAGLQVELLDGRGSNYSMQVVSSGHADIG